ncbi:bifunctional folylpolyglutamate synthase/dihydrofolate synthase [Loigolactobacillus jiayinensis]|uniref:tetrahydrofolate synthase n=1 Tax=Loigolactobacillus jiayinensis TaxID=2486016 RepID=A0ABW1RH46_9LACO|nr:folylpolyglutamate synthase/dihydrofolate synthase family protein [Loigolactobacillus jiayinensis]
MTIQQQVQAAQAEMTQGMLYEVGDRVGLLRQVLAQLGHPEQTFKVIHIAGTNGKGSTTQMLRTILTTAGYRSGAFMSPYLRSPYEQITVDGQIMTATEFLAAFARGKQALADLDLTPAALSEFEWYFILALLQFQQRQVKWAVVETGLGGEFDATNALDQPALVIFTKIAYDHMALLGNTLTAIAQTKSKIMRQGVPVISYPQQAPAAEKVLQQAAKTNQAPFWQVQQLTTQIEQFDLTGILVSVASEWFNWPHLRLSLAGEFQVANLVTVLTAIHVLQKQIDLPETVVRKALTQVKLPGRLQVIGQQPTVLLDGAHNPDGSQALVDTLQRLTPVRPVTLVIGMLRDKNYQRMLQLLLPLATQVIVTTPNNPTRELPATELATACQAIAPQLALTICAVPQQALKMAQQQTTADGLIVVTGSFYLVKELLPNA